MNVNIKNNGGYTSKRKGIKKDDGRRNNKK